MDDRLNLLFLEVEAAATVVLRPVHRVLYAHGLEFFVEADLVARDHGDGGERVAVCRHCGCPSHMPHDACATREELPYPMAPHNMQ